MGRLCLEEARNFENAMLNARSGDFSLGGHRAVGGDTVVRCGVVIYGVKSSAGQRGGILNA